MSDSESIKQNLIWQKRWWSSDLLDGLWQSSSRAALCAAELCACCAGPVCETPCRSWAWRSSWFPAWRALPAAPEIAHTYRPSHPRLWWCHGFEPGHLTSWRVPGCHLEVEAVAAKLINNFIMQCSFTVMLWNMVQYQYGSTPKAGSTKGISKSGGVSERENLLTGHS